MSNASKPADSTATLAINLQDGISTAAVSAAESLKQLRSQIDNDTAALSGMQKAMRNMKDSSLVNTDQFRKLKEAIAQKKEAIAQAQSGYLKLGGSMTKQASAGKSLEARMRSVLATQQKLPAPTVKLSGGVQKLAGELQAAGGPLGAVGGKLRALEPLLVGGRVATFAMAAAVVAFTAATAAAVVALTKLAIAHADARRNELLHLEGMTRMWRMLPIARGNAVQMQGAIDDVSARMPIARDKIAQFGQELHSMGVRGANFSAALEGMSMTASVHGDSYARMWASMAAGASLSGQSVQAMLRRVQARIGDLVDKQMYSLAVQSTKQRENFAALFNTIKVEKFLVAMGKVRGMLAQSEVTGRALRAIMVSIAQPMIDMATRAMPYLKRFFQGIVREALQLRIVFLKVQIWWLETFGKQLASGGIDGMKLALRAGQTALLGFAALLVFTTGWVIAWTAPIIAAAGAVWLLIEGVERLIELFHQGLVPKMLDKLSSGELLKFQAPAPVLRAPDGRADKPLSATEAIARMHTKTVPQRDGSKVIRMEPVPITASAPRIPVEEPAQKAVERQTRSSAEVAKQLEALRQSITVGDIHMHGMSGDPREMASMFRDELTRILERVAEQQGAVPKQVPR